MKVKLIRTAEIVDVSREEAKRLIEKGEAIPATRQQAGKPDKIETR